MLILFRRLNMMNYLTDQNAINVRVLLSLMSISLVPGFIKVAFNLQTTSYGFAAGALLVVLFNIRSHLPSLKFNSTFLLSLISVIFLILLSSLHSFFVYDNSKPILSLLLLVFSWFSSYLFAVTIVNTPSKILQNSILVVVYILITLGFIKLIYIPDFCNYNFLEKPVFPFAEENQFALALGYLSVIYALASNSKLILFSIESSILFLSWVYPCLTLFVFFILLQVIKILRFKKIYIYSALFLSPLLFYVTLLVLQSNVYFQSRLNFDNPTNLTTLVYLQGLEFIKLNLYNTYGLGIGFQMLGSEKAYTGETSDLILRLTGQPHNLVDACFVVSKFISEFGLIGVILTTMYIVFVLYYAINYKRYFNYRGSAPKLYSESIYKRTLIFGMISGFIVEFFLRGFGYFFPGCHLFMTGVFSWVMLSNKTRFLINRQPVYNGTY